MQCWREFIGFSSCPDQLHCFSMCMLCMCAHVCAKARVYMCVWRHDYVRCLSQLFSTLCSAAESLTEPRSSQTQLFFIASLLWGSSVKHWDYKQASIPAWNLHGIWTQTLILIWQPHNSLSHLSPLPRKKWLSVMTFYCAVAKGSPLRGAKCTRELVLLFLETAREPIIFSVEILILKRGCSFKIGISTVKLLTVSVCRIY